MRGVPRLQFMVMLLLLVVATSATGTASAHTTAATRALRFRTYLQAGFPEQDVFIEGDNAMQVVRVEAENATTPSILGKELYSSANAPAQDPFKVGSTPLGPFPKGRPLGFTLEAWLAARASGSYTPEGDTVELVVAAGGLVPNSLYSVWCSRVTGPPTPQIVDRPCGAEDGSENTLQANAAGTAAFSLRMDPLPESTRESTTVIRLVYHSDGKTDGTSPGEFGHDSHVQLMATVPPASGISPTDGGVTSAVAFGLTGVVGAALLFVGRRLWSGTAS